MNPILEATISYVRDGKVVNEMIINNKIRPDKVIFVSADGETADLPVTCDRETFMGWWKPTCNFIRSMTSIKIDEGLESNA